MHLPYSREVEKLLIDCLCSVDKKNSQTSNAVEVNTFRNSKFLGYFEVTCVCEIP